LSSDLFDDDVDLVSVLHVEVFRGLSFVEAFSVKEEADLVGVELSISGGTLCLWQ
jgi:hypothetical protein